MDEKKHPTQPEGNQQNQKSDSQKRAESKSTVKAGPSRSVFSKRWLYPAIYLGAAALIIGLMYVRSQMQQPGPGTQTTAGNTPPTQPTTATPSGDTYAWPVATGVTPKLTMGFFQQNGSAAEQAATLVSFDNTYAPHLGYDIKATTGKPFQVTAAVGGQVLKVDHTALNNWAVEVLSSDGNLEKYQSLAKASVQAGQSVMQGDVLGTSGTSEYENAQGNHVYFEIDNSNKPVDPATLLPKL
jgi:stage II sporulation protein Q